MSEERVVAEHTVPAWVAEHIAAERLRAEAAGYARALADAAAAIERAVFLALDSSRETADANRDVALAVVRRLAGGDS